MAQIAILKMRQSIPDPAPEAPSCTFYRGLQFPTSLLQAGKGSLQYSRKGSSSLYWVQNGKNLG